MEYSRLSRVPQLALAVGCGLLNGTSSPLARADSPATSVSQWTAPAPAPAPGPIASPEPGIGSALRAGSLESSEAPPEKEAPEPAETLTGDWGGVRTHLSDHGVTLAPVYTVEGLANVQGGQKRGAVAAGLFRCDLDLDSEKLVGLPGGTLHASSLYAHGESLSQKYVGDLFTLSNIDAWDSLGLFELWWEQSFFDHQASLRAGILAADEEFASTEYGGLFINSACGWPPFIAVNLPSPAYPYGVLGVRAAWEPTPHWHFRAAVFDGAPDMVGDDGEMRDHHGLSTELDDGALVIGEGMRTWHEGEGPGLPGNVRLGFWYHTAHFADTHLGTDGRSLADPLSNGEAADHEGNYGGYLTFEQQLTSEGAEPEQKPQGLGTFGRFGIAPSDRNTLGFYAEGGLHYLGILPGRDLDRCGIAVAYGRISDGLRGVAADARALGVGASDLPDHELIVEAAYRFHLGHGVSIQPGCDWIMHPGGSGELPDAFVLSLRATFEL